VFPASCEYEIVRPVSKESVDAIALGKLEQSEQQFRLVIETAKDAILGMDEEGRITLWNKAACTMFGYSAKESMGKDLHDLIVPERFRADARRGMLHFRQTGDGKNINKTIEQVALRCDGSEFPIELSISGMEIHHGWQTIGIIRDITDRKRDGMALQESEQRLQMIIEANPVPIIITRMHDGFVKFANRAVSIMFGVPYQEVIGQLAPDFFVHPQERDVIMRELALKGQLESREVHFCRPDGTRFWALVTFSALAFDGESSVMASIYDITEQQATEYYTRRTSEILGMVASAQPAEDIYDAICHMHEEIHPRMRSSILMLKGKQLFHCSAPSLPDAYSRAIDGVNIGPCAGSCGTAAFLGKGVMVEDIATDPLWADYKAAALAHDLHACWSEPVVGSDGSILGTFAMYFDRPGIPNNVEFKEIRNASRLVAIVMERERREAQLKQRSQAINQAGESILITDSDGIIEYANPAFTAITGYSNEEVVGKPARILKSGNQNKHFYKRMLETIISGDAWHGKVIDRKKDGSLYPTMLTVSPMKNSSGDVISYVGIQQDLSEYEKLEEQFHQAQKMEAIGTLVGGIAHDFNNLLAGITGNLYLARKGVQEKPDIVQKLNNVEQLSLRAADMIQQLLTFARKGFVSMKPLPLAPYVKETLKSLRTSLPEDIDMHQHICTDTLRIMGDGTQLHQILMNLVNNAHDALDDVDDPCIIIRLEAFHADEAFIESHPDFNTGAYARLSVEDNGCGIAEHQLEHLFEPFFTTKEVGKGTGLGLAMVFGAIKTHQGFIEVDSIEGEGTTFHIYIPLVDTDGALADAPKQLEIAKGAGETILLADDEPHIIETGREVLKALGYHVLTAVNGQQAVDVFRAHAENIDLCIFDVVMPIMNGDKAAKNIRQDHPEVKIIFATGYDKSLLTDMAHEIVLSKPFSIVAMSQLIRQQLDG